MLRLETLAKMIPPHRAFADIGCDHGYLIDLALKEGVTFAQAIDNKPLPLKKAQENLRHYHDQVVFSLSSGLDQLLPSIPCVVFAGMGGRLIVDLLKENLDKCCQIERIITEPHKNIEHVRRFLSQHGYIIVREKVIEEESIFYEIIVFEKGSIKYSEAELQFGPLLMKQKDPSWIQKWRQIDEELKNHDHPTTQKKREWIQAHVPLGDKV